MRSYINTSKPGYYSYFVMMLIVALITTLAFLSKIYRFIDDNNKTIDNNIFNDNNMTNIATRENQERSKNDNQASRIDLSNGKEYKSFFYIHTPKTGTSLYTVLRNRLSSCEVKDFTCLNQYGGGLYAAQSNDGETHFPFTVESMGWSNNTSEEINQMHNCHNTLNCKIGSYHCPFARCHARQNKVTMYREPHKWYKSYFDWIWLSTFGSLKHKKIPGWYNIVLDHN